MRQGQRFDYENLIARTDELIRSGQMAPATQLIQTLPLHQIPRRYRHQIANLCRRMGLSELGIKILYPVVRASQELATEPTSQELCEYAVLISRIGCVDEALDILDRVDELQVKQKVLYQGFCHISQWNYSGARDYLQRHLEASPDSYSAMVTSVNLALCEINLGELDPALARLNDLISLAQESHATRLEANCLELRGQIFLHQMKLARAEVDLRLAEELMKANNSYDHILVKKWLAIRQALKTRDTQPIDNFKQLARKAKHFESLRDADFFRLKIRFERELHDYLLVGTPYTSFRARVLTEFKQSPPLGVILGGSEEINLSLELVDDSPLRPGHLLHRTLAALTNDFYTPKNIGMLFSYLYPEEFFNVHTAPLKIRKDLSRLRHWLYDRRYPFTVGRLPRGYHLEFKTPFGLFVPFEGAKSDGTANQLSRLRLVFANQSRFRAREACSQLKISKSNFLRLARSAIDEGWLTRSGTGRAARYMVRSKAS